MANPNPKGVITSQYGMRQGTFHAGIDIAGGSGSPIYAFAPGIVYTAATGYNGGAGNMVIIDHQNGYYTRYLHLSTITVAKGQNVKDGQQIGTEGTTGHSTGPHLHFEIRTNPGYGQSGSLDPLPYLNGTKKLPYFSNTFKISLLAFVVIVAGLWYFRKEIWTFYKNSYETVKEKIA